MAAQRRKDAEERARIREFQERCDEITNDASRILEDPGSACAYTGYFKACFPWISVDLKSGDVKFSDKLCVELQNFSDDFLQAIKWDVVTFRGRRCIFVTFPSKDAFFKLAQNTTIPLQRLFGKSSFDGAWTSMECLNIIEWFNFPQALSVDQMRKTGDARVELEKHFSKFLTDIRVIDVDRKTSFARIEFDRDLTSEDLANIRSHPYAPKEKVKVSGLWFNKHY